MNHILKTFTGAGILLTILFAGCSNEPGNSKDKVKVLEALEAEKGEHEADVGEKGEGEEDGTQFGLSDVYDVVKYGTHLVLSFDAESNTFIGTVENTSKELVKKVRVEVHLSNGTELGPTTSIDLKPGEQIKVELKATEKAFETWSAHAEVGNNEEGHGHAGEGEGEHDSGEEGEGEHN